MILVITFIISLFPSYAMASPKAEKVVYDQNGVTITYIVNGKADLKVIL